MAKNSSFYVSSPSPFGQMATGFGKGLAESVPAEVQRLRMAEHLNKLGQQKDLTPFQQFSGLVSAPGSTPQIVQSGSELLRQQQKLGAAEQRASSLQQQQQLQNQQAVQQQQQHQNQVLDQTRRLVDQAKKGNEGFNREKYPSVPTPERFAQAQQGYVPPTIEEQTLSDLERFNNNPAFYNHDPQNALREGQAKVQREIERQNANDAIHAKQEQIQQKAVKDLKAHADNLAVKIPANLYDKYENEFLDLITPGPGKKVVTPEQGKKIISEKMDEASRDYAEANAFIRKGVLTKSPKNIRSKIDSLQQKFEKRNDTRNLADTLKSGMDISDELAYTFAEPVNKYKELNQALKNTPNSFEATRKGQFEDTRLAGRSYFPTIFDAMKKSGGSPLSAAHELRMKGYDADEWLEYATKRQDELSKLQSDQLGKDRETFGSLSDWWTSSFSGIGD